MSQTNNSLADTPGERFVQARENLFQMIEEGRSFSGHERNCCFLNTRDGRFANVSSISGLDFPDDGRALAVVDWDQDGDLDIWTSNRNAPRLRFLRNDAGQDNRFLALRLQGNGATTARDAIGARVVVTVDGGESKPLVKSLRAGEGFLAQSTKWLIFGLGDAERVAAVRVEWPGGEDETYSFSDLPVDARYVLKQGSGKAERLPEVSRELRLDRRPAEMPSPVSSYRIALAQRVPMPQRVVYERFDRGSEAVPFDRPTLVTLFASWCAPCLEELKEFSERAEEIREAGLDVVALSVDKLAADQQPPGDAEATLRHLRFPFRAGWADESFVTTMQGYHNFFVPLTRPLPVPTSFLADKRGRLLAIYKGKVSLDQVLADSRTLVDSDTAGTERLALLPGRPIDHPRIERVRQDDALRTRYFLAEVLLDVQRLPDAVVHLGEVVRMHPDCIPAWKHLATSYETLGDLVRARRAYEKLIELDKSQAWAHFNLANLLKRRQRLDEAIAGYRRALQLEPQYVEARVNLGVTLASQNRLEEALQEFERAAADRPDFEPATANLQRLRSLLGKAESK